ncbi:MAG: LysR family transcriptional regulator [Betaproteobacteria bacterium]|nr:LysR family transcriptional regulator [Betaproteobacteria bacterium]
MADRRLQVFHAVARHLSFTKAAEALFMTQPAVTFQIKQLEEHFNTRLFERGHGRISLTPAGDIVFEYAEKILGLSSEMETRLSEMTGQMRGPLLVGASTTIAEFMLPRILGEFNSLYPQVRARLTVANSETIENRIAEHTLDVGLVELQTKNPNLLSEICCDDELQVICTPDYPLNSLQSVTPKALLDYEFVSREPGSGTREVTDNYFREAGVSPERLKTLMELGSPEALKGVVGTGLGFAIVSRASVGKELQLGSLIAIPLEPRLVRRLSVLSPKEKFRSRVVSTFMEFAKRRLRELAA